MATPEQILAKDLNSEPVLDLAVFATVKAIPGIQAEIESTVNQRLQALQGIRAQPQITTELLQMFGDQAHGLKSGISMIGCRRLGLLCYKIELYGQAGKHQSGQVAFGTYDTAMPIVLQQTMQALQAAFA
eukprot:gene13545-474_t